MNYLTTPEGPFSTLHICQAYMQLESDFNVESDEVVNYALVDGVLQAVQVTA